MNNKAISQNLESWQQRAKIHINSPMYQNGIKILRGGGITLSPPTDTEIGDVSGKRVLHIQCHIGQDSLSLASLGADVTGLDFSSEAVDIAAKLSAELDIPARFVLGEAHRADEVLQGEKFDMVFASFGVFCWIENLDRWLQSAANLLAPGGVLYIADFHPFLNIIDDDPTNPANGGFLLSYFDKKPAHFPAGPTYADDGMGQNVPATVEFIHTIGDFVTFSVNTGLKIEYLHEFPYIDYQHYPTMKIQPNGTWDFPEPLKGKLPKIFSLRAIRP